MLFGYTTDCLSLVLANIRRGKHPLQWVQSEMSKTRMQKTVGEQKRPHMSIVPLLSQWAVKESPTSNACLTCGMKERNLDTPGKSTKWGLKQLNVSHVIQQSSLQSQPDGGRERRRRRKSRDVD